MPVGRIRFAFDDDVLEEFLFLASKGYDLAGIGKHSSGMPIGSSLGAIANHVSHETGVGLEAVQRVLTVLQNMQTSQKRMRLDTGEFLKSITDALADYTKKIEQPERLKSWVESLPRIEAVLRLLEPNHPLRIARKAQRLLQAHQNSMTDVRILTDLRPVFDDAGENVLESIVVHSLLIEYFESHFPRKIEIGLDASDLAALRSVVERATRKAVALQDAMKDKKWPTKLDLDDD
jgi:hypothetical protein